MLDPDQRRRTEALIAWLEEQGDEQAVMVEGREISFYMPLWGEIIPDRRLPQHRLAECRTTCCAAGSAGLMKVFNDEGFRTVWHGQNVFADVVYSAPGAGALLLLYGFEAVAAFFGCWQPFDPDWEGYEGEAELLMPRQVAAGLRSYL